MSHENRFKVRRSLTVSFSLLCFTLARVSLSADLPAQVYKTIDSSGAAPGRLQMAFWQDPDLSEEAQVSRINTLDYLARQLIDQLGQDLVACGYGELSIYMVDDYQVVLRERLSGEDFHLLHCDQATYLMGKEYLFEGQSDPYEILAEEIPASDSENWNKGGIWVREDSSIRSVVGEQGYDLTYRHVAIVDEHCLLGGALQRARLHSMGNRPFAATGEEYPRTSCGSVSDAILRLLTGLSSSWPPIEAAFLPLDSPGYREARELLGLRRRDPLPIRLLATYDIEDLPGRPLLANRYLRRCGPDLLRKMQVFFAQQLVPYRWRTTDPERYRPLERELSVLFGSENRSQP